MKIAIIGAGNMGGSLARGFVKSGFVTAENIFVTARHPESLKSYEAEGFSVSTSECNAEVAGDADFVIIAVKPWLVEEVLCELASQNVFEGRVVISVAAGLPWSDLSEKLLCKGLPLPPAMFYAIPNIAAQMCASMTFVAPVNDMGGDTAKVLELFRCVGDVLLTDEAHLGAGTALASCGLAYALRYLRASAEGGVQLGFKAVDSLNIVRQTIEGAAAILKSTGKHPEELIDMVTTPGGITIKGLNAMEEAGFTNAVIKGLLASK